MMEYSQEFEKQADCLSVVYLERAGFDPYATIAVLEKLQKLDEEEPLRKYSYFRTHPPIATRKAVIRKQITGDIEYEDYLNLLNE
jgi:predicted Zn-dependent protease